jgi:hypothetical protein
MAHGGKLLDSLVGREDLTAGQRDYLAALVRFVRDYEERELRNRFKKLKPIDSSNTCCKKTA